MVLLVRAREVLLRWATRLMSPLPERLSLRLQDLIPAFVDGMSSLRTNREALRVVAISLLAWLVEVAFYWLMARAFGMDLDIHSALVLMIAANLVVSLPLTPWSVGPYELAVTRS